MNYPQNGQFPQGGTRNGVPSAQTPFDPDAVNPEDTFPEDTGPVVVTPRAAIIVPDNRYHVQIVEVKNVTTTFGSSVKIAFQILDGDFAGMKVSGMCSNKLNSSDANPSKLFLWLAGLGYGPDDFPEGQPFDLGALLVNRQCDVMVEQKTGPQGTFANVTKIIGAAAPRQASPAAAPAPAPQYIPPARPAAAHVASQPRPMTSAPRAVPPVGQAPRPVAPAPLQRPVAPQVAPRPATPQGDDVNF